jgi:hypothetical protein
VAEPERHIVGQKSPVLMTGIAVSAILNGQIRPDK